MAQSRTCAPACCGTRIAAARMVIVMDDSVVMETLELNEARATLWSACPARLEDKDFIFIIMADTSTGAFQQVPGQITFDKILVLDVRSEEHTSELQSHGLISYAVFCLKKK